MSSSSEASIFTHQTVYNRGVCSPMFLTGVGVDAHGPCVWRRFAAVGQVGIATLGLLPLAARDAFC